MYMISSRATSNEIIQKDITKKCEEIKLHFKNLLRAKESSKVGRMVKHTHIKKTR